MGRTTYQGEPSKDQYYESAPLPNRPIPDTSLPPPHLPLISYQGKRHARIAPFHIVTRG